MASIGTATVHVVLNRHTPLGVKAYDVDGMTVPWRTTPAGRITGYSIDCACEYRGPMMSTPEAATNAHLRHVHEVVLEEITQTSPPLDIGLVD